MTYFQELAQAIRRLHGCIADHVETVPITETFQGKVVWQGDVEVFNVRGHPKTTRCYAWGYETDDKRKKYMAILEIPPVDSARSAVKAAIVAESKNKTQ